MPSIQTSVVLRKQIKPQSSFKSIVFKRSVADISKTPPTGGSYDSPVPAGWSDGIPAEDSSGGSVWMSIRVFTSDGKSPQTPKWTNPVVCIDNKEWDYAYSAKATQPDPPKDDDSQTQTGDWHDEPKDGDIWMAMRKKSNGNWGKWSVLRIKGEKGENGKDGINGTEMRPNLLDCTDFSTKTGGQLAKGATGNRWLDYDGTASGDTSAELVNAFDGARYFKFTGSETYALTQVVFNRGSDTAFKTAKLQSDTVYTLSFYYYSPAGDGNNIRAFVGYSKATDANRQGFNLFDPAFIDYVNGYKYNNFGSTHFTYDGTNGSIYGMADFVPTDAGIGLEKRAGWRRYSWTFKTLKSALPIASYVHISFLMKTAHDKANCRIAGIKLEAVGTGLTNAQIDASAQLKADIMPTAWCKSEFDKTGDKGDKGDKGDTGAQGLDGAIHRVTEWAVGKSYNDGTKLEGNYRYLDIVHNQADKQFYKCTQYIETSVNSPDKQDIESIRKSWQKLQDTQPIYTPLIMADNAVLNFASSQQLLLRKNNVTYAGLAAGVTYPLWVGGTDGAAAPFRVSTDGRLSATGATIGGLTYRQMKEVSQYNLSEFYTKEQYTEAGSTTAKEIYVANVLKMGNWINFVAYPNADSLITDTLYFPQRVSNGSDGDAIFAARALVGQTIMLYNVTQGGVKLAGVTTPNGGVTTLDKPFTLPKGYMAEITCKISRSSGGWETIGWYVTLLCPYSKEAGNTSPTLTATFAYPTLINSSARANDTIGWIQGGYLQTYFVQISAHVTDEYGFSWQGAKLTLSAKSGSEISLMTNATATTDENGNATFSAVLQYPSKSGVVSGVTETKTFKGQVQYAVENVSFNGQTVQLRKYFDTPIEMKWTLTYIPTLAS